MDAMDALNRYFGYTSFRPGQQDVVEKLIQGEDVLAVMPTGSGKSICYQIPALVEEGTTLVISPLISLMKDQVDALRENGIPAAYINSNQSEAEQQAVYDWARKQAYRLLYVAPERMQSPRFLRLLAELRVPLVAVDEAHCISQWGHDFRPSYLEIPNCLQALGRRPVLAAFTATATPKVMEDIEQRLGMRDVQRICTGVDRPNLLFSVEHPRDRSAWLRAFLSRRMEQSGIIYCGTRNNVETVCEQLQKDGLPATRYHAGLGEREREANQEAFMFDRALIMVATNAFGMGIDKSNVRYVLHYNMPLSIENYYQEAGRAGRDGEQAVCTLLYSAADVVQNRRLIQSSRSADPAIEYAKLSDMIDYCNTDRCLRGYLLDAFAQAHDWVRCGACGNCLSKDCTDITQPAQKILSCVRRMGERYGARMVTDVLRGSRARNVERAGLTALSTHGILSDMPERTIQQIIAFLISEGYLYAQPGRYPTLQVTAKAVPLLKGSAPLIIGRSLDLDGRLQGSDALRARTPLAGSAEREGESELFKALRVQRARIARQQGTPAYNIFSDRTLEEVCRRKPATLEEFGRVDGVSEKKCRRYGEEFLQTIREWERAQAKDAAASPGALESLEQALRELRRQFAQQKKLPAFCIFSNQTLRELQKRLPRTHEALLQVPGLGESRVLQYGDAILQTIDAWYKADARP